MIFLAILFGGLLVLTTVLLLLRISHCISKYKPRHCLLLLTLTMAIVWVCCAIYAYSG